MALPGPAKDIWSFWRDIQRKTRSIDVALVGQPGPVRDAWQEALLAGSSYSQHLAVIPLDRPEPVVADLAFALLDPDALVVAGPPPALRDFDRSRLVGVWSGPSLDPLHTRQAEASFDLPTERLVAAPSPQTGAGAIGHCLSEYVHELVIPVSRQFPILREGVAWAEIQATAKQNALVGLLPLPGSDMPIMTANQIKMILRLAAIYDLPLEGERVREILAVVGGGFGLRTVARQVIKIVPGGGWLVSGAMGYTGTLAVGKAAIEYFRRLDR
ncbi:MAG: DUF697 domain-containing protein, partial [Cyanobacteria bacterium REEB65]|nr:DUF697 domain-containing protein [Cyanobacteria bacterium REEB65]